jgi:WD40-like Beta Propeller Repeat
MRIRALLIACLVVAGSIMTATPAQAEPFGSFTEWSPPVNLGVPLNTAAEESAPALSDDGASLYFNRNPNLDGDNDEDLYVSNRSREKDGPRQWGPWGEPLPLESINTATSNERNATLSTDGLLMFFSSDRPGGSGLLDLYLSRRTDRNDDQGWGPPVNLGSTVNSSAQDVGPAYVEDEAGSTVLYFTSTRSGGFGAADIYKSTLGADGLFGPPVLVRELSSPLGDARPAIRADGLELILHSNRSGPPLSCPADSPSPSGGQDLWVSARSAVTDPWGCPVNLGAVVNSSSNDLQADLSDDAEVLFFSSNRPTGGFGRDDLWMSTREPQTN